VTRAVLTQAGSLAPTRSRMPTVSAIASTGRPENNRTRPRTALSSSRRSASSIPCSARRRTTSASTGLPPSIQRSPRALRIAVAGGGPGEAFTEDGVEAPKGSPRPGDEELRGPALSCLEASGDQAEEIIAPPCPGCLEAVCELPVDRPGPEGRASGPNSLTIK